MGKKPPYGECKLCGRYSALTYEHVPPKSAFNDLPANLVSGDEVIHSLSEERLPWDLSNLRKTIQQRGKGGYYLCRSCNENTGSWYVPHFEKFVRGVFHAVYTNDELSAAVAVQLRADSIRPLPIIKQIMVMFCDINHDCFGDQNLRTFLLDKNNNSSFNKQKYRVFCYIAKGPLFRMNGISVNCLNVFGDAPMFVTMSEISSVPLGFALYIDLPDGFKPKGCEITDFSDFRYDESVACEFTIPALESNVVFSGDYRTQQEIMKTIEENEERKKEHKGDNP